MNQVDYDEKKFDKDEYGNLYEKEIKQDEKEKNDA